MGRTKKGFVRGKQGFERGDKLPPVVYGLQGIQDIFQVSKATASRYANGVLKKAVNRYGNVFIIDTEQALRCFGVENPRVFIKR